MILVTGGTGFLGSYLICHLLAEGKKLRAIKRKTSSLDEFNYISSFRLSSPDLLKNLSWIDADILDTGSLEDAFEGISEVYHCAATVSFFPKHRKQMTEVNITGTTNMVNAALDYKVAKFCHVSSIAALGRSSGVTEIDENAKWENDKNNSAYAISKHLAEMEVWRAIQEGLNAVIVNPGIITGAGDFKKGPCKMYEGAYKGVPFYTPGINGFVDVDDVCLAMIALMEKNIFNERFVLVGENIPFRTFFDTAHHYFNRPASRFNTPQWLGNVGWRVLALWERVTGIEPFITQETASAAYQSWYYNSSKIKKFTGLNFTPIEETIKETCRRFESLNQPS